MIYRHKGINSFAITIAGIGNVGIDAAMETSKMLQKILDDRNEFTCKIITNSNEVSFICNIDAVSDSDSQDDLVLWDDNEIEAQRKTKRLFVIIGAPSDPGFKMFHSTAVSVLSTPDYMRIAVLISEESRAMDNSTLFFQQMDHIIRCDGTIDAAEITKKFIYCTYFPQYDIETFGERNFRNLVGSTHEKIYATHKRVILHGNALAETAVCQAAEKLLKEINREKEYIVVAFLEGDISMKELTECIDQMRITIGTRLSIQDEIVALKINEKREVQCFLSFIEV